MHTLRIWKCLLSRAATALASIFYAAAVSVFEDGTASLQVNFDGNILRFSLIPVPPHGRLIDADELESKGADIRDTWADSDGREDSVWGFSHGMLADAPTIIQAEEAQT